MEDPLEPLDEAFLSRVFHVPHMIFAIAMYHNFPVCKMKFQ
jgi:hypothetical protein